MNKKSIEAAVRNDIEKQPVNITNQNLPEIDKDIMTKFPNKTQTQKSFPSQHQFIVSLSLLLTGT